MNVTALCITWNRPELLGRSIHCFLQQTDSNTRLLVLDDAGQYRRQEHERWVLVSTPNRYKNMGEKRNASFDLAMERFPKTEGIMLWDDDDVHFPHAVESVAGALEKKVWAQPRLVLELSPDKQSIRKVETFIRRREPFCASIAYGGCWAWRVETFRALGKFPSTNHSEDLKISRPCEKRYGPSADSTLSGNPWYFYNRTGKQISDQGRNFYAMRGREKIKPVENLSIGWNGPDITKLPIDTNIHPRPF